LLKLNASDPLPPPWVWRGGVKWRPIYYWPIWPICVPIYTSPLMEWLIICPVFQG
jgi:hypothetical protein